MKWQDLRPPDPAPAVPVYLQRLRRYRLSLLVARAELAESAVRALWEMGEAERARETYRDLAAAWRQIAELSTKWEMQP